MTLAEILDWHQQHYPLLEAPDIYKLLHQGVFGPGHIIRSAADARSCLEDEVRELRPETRSQRGGLEERIEPIDPDGKLVRVNLRLLAEEPGVVDRLVAALVESANSVKGDPEELARRLEAAVEWCRKHLPGQAGPLAELAISAAGDGFRARHHSDRYLAAYRPAYRVVLARLWPVPSGS